ncbi:aldehyde ferredoxin oxidoreductase [Halorussus limi]|uniref:Aldehyde ferredoxin oxidoreductase n=1 Tax=Halorussus limi TaxID=2938695 RepID=A0A8U0HW93_9EURY|nr:aldehyde ferredoxin oxidoreductase C-terminal domain-containing protein [Halorussus limi]UPV75385.1 aldehyde ferredoxin oxidoreductase [Halorussus limi]
MGGGNEPRGERSDDAFGGDAPGDESESDASGDTAAGDAPPEHLLRVNLTAGRVETEPIPERWRRRYLGGKGLAARYLYDELAPGTDPLGPENVLLFALGPLSGFTPGEQRYAAVTKSPLTGTFLDSYAGGDFPAALAGALRGGESRAPDGRDPSRCLAVLVEGAADEPTVLRIAADGATLEPAGDLWGADAAETCAAFDAPVACVGPAGERGVRYATIASDGGDHQAGRGGAGAVMGSKNLKAVVAGSDPPEPPDALADLREAYEARFADGETGRWQAASETVETVDFADEVGVLPTRGWSSGAFEGASAVGIEAVRRAAVAREREGPIPGGFRVETESETVTDANASAETADANTSAEAANTSAETGDGETVPRGATAISLGSGLGIADFDAVAALGGACDRLGIDVISAGNAVAWAVRASEEGVLDRDLAFGDEAAARDLLGEIARRDTELGDLLARGVDAAADRYGGDDFVPTVKAMELPTYDPRGATGMALAYATSDRGACHRRARPVVEEVFATESWSDERRAETVVAEQDARSLLWSLVVDDFAGETFEDLGATWLSAVGLDRSPADLRTAGERIWTLTRLFNVREGFDRADDELPAKLTEPLEGGPNEGEAIDSVEFEALLSAYYDRRGWDERGRPTRGLLERLDLLDAVDDETPVG